MKLFSKIAVALSLFLTCSLCHGQNDYHFAPPMQIEPVLSANFGELRKNHFHSGLDYRTESRTGIPVYASEDGYIARIFVSPYGFGRAAYVNHGSQYTSVYAHLDAFSPDIEKYIKEQQYSTENFAINVFPDKMLFPLKKGDFIGYSGNSGSSGGPHLHFEIRDQKSEEPLNPLGLKLIQIADNIPPTIKKLIIYQIDSIKNILTLSINKEIILKERVSTDTVLVPATFFIGVESFDNMPNSTNEYLAKQVVVMADSAELFDFNMTQFAFDESRYVNSVIDYELFSTKRREIIRAFKDPNNKLSLLSKMNGNGIITLADSKPHLISLLAIDNNGNETHAEVWVKGIKKKTSKKPRFEDQIPIYFFKKQNQIIRANATISIPGKSVYNSMFVSYKEEPNPKGFGRAILIGESSQPLHDDIELKIKAYIPDKYAEKAFVARGSNTSYTCIGGDYSNGQVSTTSSEFGRFFVDIDTIAPIIEPKLTVKNELIPINSSLIFSVSDDKTGIDTFDAYIDGKWAITEFDVKNGFAIVNLDEDRITKETKHVLEFYITDKVGNVRFLKSLFYF